MVVNKKDHWWIIRGITFVVDFFFQIAYTDRKTMVTCSRKLRNIVPLLDCHEGARRIPSLWWVSFMLIYQLSHQVKCFIYHWQLPAILYKRKQIIFPGWIKTIHKLWRNYDVGNWLSIKQHKHNMLCRISTIFLQSPKLSIWIPILHRHQNLRNGYHLLLVSSSVFSSLTVIKNRLYNSNHSIFHCFIRTKHTIATIHIDTRLAQNKVRNELFIA